MKYVSEQLKQILLGTNYILQIRHEHFSVVQVLI